ncbi:hypothetical protein LEMLEM_LOCUS17942, partial [Lemmus lemmus]
MNFILPGTSSKRGHCSVTQAFPPTLWTQRCNVLSRNQHYYTENKSTVKETMSIQVQIMNLQIQSISKFHQLHLQDNLKGTCFSHSSYPRLATITSILNFLKYISDFSF